MKRRRALAAFAAWCVVFTGLVLAPGAAVADDTEASAVPQAESAERVLFEDDFSSNDGAGWIVTKANAAAKIVFSGGIATITGGGPENRIVSDADVLGHDITLSFDLFVHAGNTNAAIKAGFFSDQSGSNRHQVTWDGPHSTLRLEKVVNGVATTLGERVDLALPVNTDGTPYRFEITIAGDRVVVAVDGASYLDVADAGIATAAEGRVLFAGQFPAQDFSVDDVRATTTEPDVEGQYTVEVATKTDGTMDSDTATAGGTLSANRTSGDAGDVVALSHTVKPGYVFEGYESLRADTGTSTDGLLTITDNRFTLDDKTGSVIIIAKFVTEPDDPNVVFKDYFTGPLNEHGDYTFNAPSAMGIEDGALRIAQTTGVAYALVDSSGWGEPVDHRVELDARKLDGTAGTVQIAFRGDSFSDRYVLALNGSKALLRRIDAQGANIELASALYTFDQTSRRLIIDVTGDTVSVTSDGVPVLSYVNKDDDSRDAADWSGLKPGLNLINMTAGAPVAFDNVKVVRVPVRVTAKVELTVDGAPDPDRRSGAVILSSYVTGAGETLTWRVSAKGGYAFEGMTFNGAAVADSGLVVPETSTTPITLVANFTRIETTPTTYYVDSVGGDDAHDGTSEAGAWASLAKLDRIFHPGDRILLRRGSVFEGADAALRFRGSGTAEHPIVVGAYGEGDLPRLDGAGQVENVVGLDNQEHITISHLEITNLDAAFGTTFELNANTNRERNLRAVNVSARDFGVVKGIRLTDLYIHDVNGNLAAKWNGGIFFDVGAQVADGELRGVPTKYDGVRIERNVLERVDRSGIKLVSSAWANQSLANSPGTPLNWYPSTDVVIRDNQLRYMGGDAITVRDTDGTLIEYNLARHSRYQNTGYNAGIWPFQATNTVIQHNEVSHTHGVQDGQGFDTDHVSAYTVMQYNYSHDNEGGFMLIMNGFPHTAPTIRYNISQNDADKTFEFARGTAAGTMIYNNTISSKTLLQGPRGGVLDLANSAAGTGNREVYIFNNVFDYPEGQTFYVGEAETMKTKAKLFNNAYLGGIEPPAEEEQPILGDAGLPGLGTAPDDADAIAPHAGENAGDHFAGYIPADESTLRAAGVSVDAVVERYDGTITDRRDLSPTQIHALALQGKSIDFAAGGFLPEISGVRYDVDFLGIPLPTASDSLTIGAIQHVDDTSDPGADGDGSEGGDGTEGGGEEGAGSDDAGSEDGDADAGADAGTPAAGGEPADELATTGASWPIGLIALGAVLLLAGWRIKRARSAA